MKRLKLSMDKRRMLEGLIFVLPFILGTIFFFVFPLYVSFKLSFGRVSRMAGFVIEWVGMENYVRAFIVDTNFIPVFLNLIRQTLIKAPLIIVFSLIIGIMINKAIRCRGFFRLVFFMPFLLGSGEVMRQLLGQGIDRQIVSIADGTLIPKDMLAYLGANAVSTIDTFFGVIVTILWSSSVQVLLFLSGLQNIPISLFESSRVEGATEWEMFWKITLPMILPVMLLNIIYTIVDSFIDINNQLLTYIQNHAFRWLNFGYAAAMGWLYFICILLLLFVIIGGFGKVIRRTNA